MDHREDRGRNAASPADIPPRGLLDIARRTWREASDDNLGLIAAGVAFYGFLALVPTLAALVLIYGLAVDPAALARHVAELAATMPAEAARLIDEQLHNLIESSAGKKGLGLALALLVALYGATKGAGAVITALNIIYDEKEGRGFVARTGLSIAITLGAVLTALALLLAVSAGHALESVAQGIAPAAAFALKLVGWLLAGTIASAAIAALYRFAPARADARWRWLTPGSIFATVGIVAASAGFGWYAASFGNYNATYGSLGAVVVLLMWFYLSAYVLLLGAELNAEIERQTAVDTTTGAPEPLGSRKAAMADQVAAAE